MATRRTLLQAALLGAAHAALSGPARAAAAAPMRIGVIGAGNVGGTIGALWVRAGHEVMFASRHPDELRAMAQALGPGARVGTPREAAGFGQAILMAVPYGALPQLGQDLAGPLRGKVVLDATNPFPGRDGAPAERAQAQGAGTVSAELLPGTRLVRAFNSMSAATVGAQAHRPGAPLAIPIAGDDAQALAVAQRLVRDAGLDPVVVGPLSSARLFQPGGPGWQVADTAEVLRKRLGLP